MARQSPGYRRMRERMGPDAFERMRLDTLRLQEEALAGVRSSMKLNRPDQDKHELTRDIIKGKRK